MSSGHKSHVGRTAVIVCLLALVGVIIITHTLTKLHQTTSVTGDMLTGWEYQTIPGYAEKVPVRCLPSTDVQVTLVDSKVVAVQNLSCGYAVNYRHLAEEQATVEGDVYSLLNRTLTITYSCQPAAGGIGSGVLRMTTGDDVSLVESQVCGPL